jgi:hypothetical protein
MIYSSDQQRQQRQASSNGDERESLPIMVALLPTSYMAEAQTHSAGHGVIQLLKSP